ncbi:hypothetical protein PYCC9005_004532 [Savitreella phatthalungensis]
MYTLQLLPDSLCQLLDSVLEEELYSDYADLLLQLQASFAIPDHYLIACCSLLVHRTLSSDPTLSLACTRVLNRSIKQHGAAAFRHAIAVDKYPADGDATSRRFKRRRITPNLTSDIALPDIAPTDTSPDALFAPTVFLGFGSALPFLETVLNVTPAESPKALRGWLTIAGLVMTTLELDWEETVARAKDLSKTLIGVMVSGSVAGELKRALRGIFTWQKVDLVSSLTFEIVQLRARLAKLLLTLTNHKLPNIIPHTTLTDLLADQLMLYEPNALDLMLSGLETKDVVGTSKAILVRLCLTRSLPDTEIVGRCDWDAVCECMRARTHAVTAAHTDQALQRACVAKARLLAAYQQLYPDDPSGENVGVGAVRALRAYAKQINPLDPPIHEVDSRIMSVDSQRYISRVCACLR